MTGVPSVYGRIFGLIVLLVALAQSLAAAERTTLLVAEVSNSAVRHFSLDGADLGSFAVAGLEEPSGLALDRDGNVYSPVLLADHEQCPD